MADTSSERFGNIDIILINLSYYFIWAANLSLILVDKGFVASGQDKGFIRERARLESAASMVKAAVTEMYNSGKMAKKTEEQITKLAKSLEKTGAGADKSLRFLQGAVGELELFDEFFASQPPQDFAQLQRDANEFLAMNILYLYDTYINADVTDRTYEFLQKVTGEPVNRYVAQTAKYFRDKSQNIR